MGIDSTDWRSQARAQGIRPTDDRPAPRREQRALHPNQVIGHDVPTEGNRDGIVLDAEPLNKSSWYSVTTGESGVGPISRNNGKHLIEYDPS